MSWISTMITPREIQREFHTEIVAWISMAYLIVFTIYVMYVYTVDQTQPTRKQSLTTKPRVCFLCLLSVCFGSAGGTQAWMQADLRLTQSWYRKQTPISETDLLNRDWQIIKCLHMPILNIQRTDLQAVRKKHVSSRFLALSGPLELTPSKPIANSKRIPQRPRADAFF